MLVFFHHFFSVITCPKKCNIRIYYLHGNTNSLRKIDLTIGTWEKMFHSCSGLFHPIYLKINCSSWNASKSLIQKYIMNNAARKGMKLMFLQIMSLFEIILKRNIKINSLYLIKKQIHVIGEYIIRGSYNACCINDAQCVRIHNYCICHCMPGYILEGESV